MNLPSGILIEYSRTLNSDVSFQNSRQDYYYHQQIGKWKLVLQNNLNKWCPKIHARINFVKKLQF